MASISKESGGRKTIQFIGTDKKRRSLRLGKASLRIAEAVKVRVEHLVTSHITGHALDDETARWVAGLDITFSDKLAAVGLVARQSVTTLAAFLDGYIESRGDVKENTVITYNHSRRCLVEFFGAGKSLRDITPGDADEWRLWMLNDQKLSKNTVRRRCGYAKQYFKAALRKKLIESNPFAELPSTVHGNVEKMYFVTLQDADAVLDACPDAEWRLIFALSRFGGLRCPSEHLALRWEDVD